MYVYIYLRILCRYSYYQRKTGKKSKTELCVEVLIEVLKLVPTLFIIPLLFLQVLDCYEWTCLFFDKYCGKNRDPYKLSLDQTVVTICYSIAVFIIQGLAGIAKDKWESTLFYPKLKKTSCESDANKSYSLQDK